MTSVLLFLSHSVTQIEYACVCVCVLGDDVSLFISDPSYATQVIQHAGPREGYTLESVYVHVYVCVH